MGALYGPQFMLQQRNKNRIGVIEKTSDVLDVYFMFPPSSSGASVMRAAHITLDLAGIATGDLPALQRFISLRPAMGLKYINVRKISVLLDRFLGKGQYYMLSHYDLQQNQKATSTFPASFLHQNKERMLKKTDEARARRCSRLSSCLQKPAFCRAIGINRWLSRRPFPGPAQYIITFCLRWG